MPPDDQTTPSPTPAPGLLDSIGTKLGNLWTQDVGPALDTINKVTTKIVPGAEQAQEFGQSPIGQKIQKDIANNVRQTVTDPQARAKLQTETNRQARAKRK